MRIQLVSARCVDEEASQTYDPADLPPFTVIYPGVTRGRTDLLCYACFVPMRSAEHNGLSAISLQVQDCPGKMASSVQPMRQGEPLDEKMIISPKVIARELAAAGGQAISLLEGNQATLVTSQIIVTAQQEQTKCTSIVPPIGTKMNVPCFGGLIPA